MDTLMTPRELAEYLGVPLATVYRWRYLAEGPMGFRIGRHVRYRRADVEAWVESRRDNVRKNGSYRDHGSPS
jgi:excisionase family DNA binding protein